MELYKKGENKSLKEKKKRKKITCPSATLSTINPTWSGLRQNPGCRGDRQAGTYCLSHGTALSENKKKAVLTGRQAGMYCLSHSTALSENKRKAVLTGRQAEIYCLSHSTALSENKKKAVVTGRQAGMYCLSHSTALSENKKKAVCAYF